MKNKHKQIELYALNNRTYLWVDEKRVKMIPLDYQQMFPDTIYLCLNDFKKLRLTISERKNLNNMLSDLLIKEFLKGLAGVGSEKYVYDLIKGSKPKTALHVNCKVGPVRHELLFKNGVRVKCSTKIYRLFEPKETIFSNY